MNKNMFKQLQRMFIILVMVSCLNPAMVNGQVPKAKDLSFKNRIALIYNTGTAKVQQLWEQKRVRYSCYTAIAAIVGFLVFKNANSLMTAFESIVASAGAGVILDANANASKDNVSTNETNTDATNKENKEVEAEIKSKIEKVLMSEQSDNKAVADTQQSIASEELVESNNKEKNVVADTEQSTSKEEIVQSTIQTNDVVLSTEASLQSATQENTQPAQSEIMDAVMATQESHPAESQDEAMSAQEQAIFESIQAAKNRELSTKESSEEIEQMSTNSNESVDHPEEQAALSTDINDVVADSKEEVSTDASQVMPQDAQGQDENKDGLDNEDDERRYTPIL